jgi:hypothetical protein
LATCRRIDSCRSAEYISTPAAAEFCPDFSSSNQAAVSKTAGEKERKVFLKLL